MLVPQPWKHVISVQTHTALHAFYYHIRGQANACRWTCPSSIKSVLPWFYLWRKTCDVAYQALSLLVQQWEGPGDEARLVTYQESLRSLENLRGRGRLSNLKGWGVVTNWLRAWSHFLNYFKLLSLLEVPSYVVRCFGLGNSFSSFCKQIAVLQSNHLNV